MKIALALIVKGDDKEALLLDRALENSGPFVDGIFVTSTYKKGEKPNRQVEKIAKLHNAHYSTFEWVNDFAFARNANFSLVPAEYDYILWMDADDVYRGLDNMRPMLEEHKNVDMFLLWYMYEFDKYKMPTVVHKKPMLIKNDGCVKWAGRLHEDFVHNRQLSIYLCETIKRMHLTTDERVDIARVRNVEVSKADADANPDDPRVYYNLGNSYIGAGLYDKAKGSLSKFLTLSNSDEEKYNIRLRLASIENALGNKQACIEHYWTAIGMKPDYPDAYFQLGYALFSFQRFDEAENYLIKGLMKPKQEAIMKSIFYNPRDYDYNPMMLLAKVYFEKNRPDLALPMLKGCLQIYPDNKEVKDLVEEMQYETDRMVKVIGIVSKLEEEKDIEVVRKTLKTIDPDLRSHPAVCAVRNKWFKKTESSGKDLVYYCGQNKHEWNPEMAKNKGIGGSEEAVINLSKQWKKSGWNVTVYNNCGHEEMICDGVTYKPFWEFNPKDKQDVVILWRNPRYADEQYGINASKIYVDLHDVVGEGEFTESRLKRIDKIFVKTQFHRSLFPNIPDEKFVVIPNGQDFHLFDQKVKKNLMMLVNTSSPDRSLDVLPELFKRVKEQVPEARLKWAYGWEIFDNTFSHDEKRMAWKTKILKDMEEAGIENMGRLSQKECAKLYLEGNILAYPTEFAEIDCITVKKAQACGCMPITTDFGAMQESVQHGVKVHSTKTKDNWSAGFKMGFGIEDEKAKQEWIDAVVKQLKTPMGDRKEMKKWAKKFEWPLIAKSWDTILCSV